jgi:hypothetical protein
MPLIHSMQFAQKKVQVGDQDYSKWLQPFLGDSTSACARRTLRVRLSGCESAPRRRRNTCCTMQYWHAASPPYRNAATKRSSTFRKRSQSIGRASLLSIRGAFRGDGSSFARPRDLHQACRFQPGKSQGRRTAGGHPGRGKKRESARIDFEPILQEELIGVVAPADAIRRREARPAARPKSAKGRAQTIRHRRELAEQVAKIVFTAPSDG